MADKSTFSSIKTPPTLKQIAYEEIKKSIILGALRPGDIYSEQSLAQQLEISKTPVREALINLKIKGFIDILPQKGFQVKRLTAKEITDIFEFRAALERAVILHVTPEIQALHIQKLETIMGQVGKAKDMMLFLTKDMEFHRYLASLTQNHQIINALEGIWDFCIWVGYAALEFKGSAEEAQEEHLAIVERLRRREALAAEEAVNRHTRSTLAKILKVVVP